MRDLPTNGAVFDIGGNLLARRGVFEKFLSRPGILGLLGTLPQSRSLLPQVVRFIHYVPPRTKGLFKYQIL
jgi:hypothetical protein